MASAAHVEAVKKSKNPLDVLEDIRRYAREGLAAIDPDDRDIRFRWFGLYTQRPLEDGYFMLRVKLPGGQATADQFEALADISERYGCGVLDVTDRQNVQFHWLRIEDIPAVFDATPALEAASRHVTGNREFSDLPRKYRVSIAACGHRCTHPEINDVALVGVSHGDMRGFDLWVGGGLSTAPRFATPLGVFVPEAEAVETSLGRPLADGPPAPDPDDPLADRLEADGLSVGRRSYRAQTMACTGIEFCKLADIGLLGSRVKVGGEARQAYQVYLGGRGGARRRSRRSGRPRATRRTRC
ncbi:MAG TPA: nitrite/sulfite reductase [Thermodesulfobacteriota bacterium]